MYQITYKKKNGDIFYRYRNSLPGTIGDETSMGWIIMDIKYAFKNNYYSLRDYQNLSRKQYKRNHIKVAVTKFLKRYATTMALIILFPLYLFK